MVKNRKKYDCNRKINGKFWIIIVFFTVVCINATTLLRAFIP